MPRRRAPRVFEQRLVTAIESGVRHSLRGRVSNAAPSRIPVPNRASQDTRTEIRFNQNGALSVSASDPTQVRNDRLINSMVCTLTAAGSTSTVVELYRNDTSIASVTIAASATTARVDDINAHLVADSDLIKVGVTTAGTGAAGLVAEVRLT